MSETLLSNHSTITEANTTGRTSAPHVTGLKYLASAGPPGMS